MYVSPNALESMIQGAEKILAALRAQQSYLAATIEASRVFYNEVSSAFGVMPVPNPNRLLLGYDYVCIDPRINSVCELVGAPPQGGAVEANPLVVVQTPDGQVHHTRLHHLRGNALEPGGDHGYRLIAASEISKLDIIWLSKDDTRAVMQLSAFDELFIFCWEIASGDWTLTPHVVDNELLDAGDDFTRVVRDALKELAIKTPAFDKPDDLISESCMRHINAAISLSF